MSARRPAVVISRKAASPSSQSPERLARPIRRRNSFTGSGAPPFLRFFLAPPVAAAAPLAAATVATSAAAVGAAVAGARAPVTPSFRLPSAGSAAARACSRTRRM